MRYRGGQTGKMLMIKDDRDLEVSRERSAMSSAGRMCHTYSRMPGDRWPSGSGSVRYDFEEQGDVQDLHHFSVVLSM